MAGQPEPDIFVRILNKVEHIDRIDAQLRGMTADVRDIKADVRHIKTVLSEHTLRLNQLDTAVVELHQDFKQHLALSPS